MEQISLLDASDALEVLNAAEVPAATQSDNDVAVEVIEVENAAVVIPETSEVLDVVSVPEAVPPTPKPRRKRSVAVAAPAPTPEPRARKSAKPVNELGVVDQVRRAFAPRNRFATSCGFLLGGFVPTAVFTLVHFEVQANPYLWALVLGGLIYSAITVFNWGAVAFSSKAKALGFVLLIEGVLTFSQTSWLSGIALAFLVAINGIATGTNLIANQIEKKR